MDARSRWFILLFAAVLAPPAASQGFPTRDFAMGEYTAMSALGDLDNDGAPDLLTAVDAGFVGVRRSQVGTWFGPLASFAAQAGTACVAVGDVNGDGFADVVTANRASSTVSVLHGDGAGNLTLVSSQAGGSEPQWVALADFNGDGLLDFAAPQLHDFVRIYTNLGAPGFVNLTSALGGIEPRMVVTGDWNGDGVVDLATCDRYAKTLVPSRGVGDGTFLAPFLVNLTAPPHAIVTRDFDGNGVADLAAPTGLDINASKIEVAYGGGMGTFSSPFVHVAPHPAAHLLTEDLDFDGRLDFVVPAYAGTGVHLGTSGGVWQFHQLVYAGSAPEHAAVADVNGDSKFDLVTTNHSTVTVALGDGLGGFRGFDAYPIEYDARAVLLRDFDHDGALDAVTASRTTGALRVSYGGPAGFAQSLTVGVPTKPASLAAGDFNADGNLDVAAGCDIYNALAVWLGSPSGLTASAATSGTLQDGPALALADMNLDGRLDVVTFHDTAGQLAWWRGSGQGTFGNVNVFTTLPFPVSGAASDLDGDGDADVAVASYFPGGGIAVHVNTGTGSLTPPALVNSTPFLFVAAGDVQGDGIPDLAGAVSGSDVLLFAGTGGGSFGPPLTVAAGKFPRSIAIGDVNSDGLADLTVVRWDGASSACSIARASAPGVFQPPLDIALLPQAEAVALGDLDSDGDPDLAAVCAAPSNLVVLRNDLTETPSTQLFGAGTSGSRGRLGLRAPSAPAVNHPGFGVAGTNAPAAALGLALVANAADVNGSDPFAIGAALHVNLLTATEVLAFDVRSDAAGCAYLPAPIPNSPVLSGAVYHAQFLFFEGFGEKTTPSPFGLVSSKGLTIAIP